MHYDCDYDYDNDKKQDTNSVLKTKTGKISYMPPPLDQCLEYLGYITLTTTKTIMESKSFLKLNFQFSTKGQLISKGIFGVFNSSKKRTKKRKK